MKTKAESFEDIVFENRNKAYGAYELRKRYPKRGTIALIIAMLIMFFAVGIPLVANMLRDAAFRKYVENNTEINLENMNHEKNDVPPPPPAPPAPPVRQIAFIAPKIVDSLSDPVLEMDAVTDLVGNNNTSIDTTSAKPKIDDAPIPKNDIPETPVEIFTLTERPDFPGGDPALLKYVAENTIYPQEAIDGEIEGTVYVRFVVTKTGKIGEANVMRSVDPILDKEALRVIKTLPTWKPGKINGNAVNVWFIIPVKFQLNKANR